ncbi:hypothetical protein [Arthrobacter sp. NPDC057013]|uniref:hypothetical protein n=1 Tax=Arthrobacter sp. NPDC057013 TaxID=3345999 RepID=UPI0036357BF7
MSGQRQAPVPESTPLPSAPQPDGHSPGWGFGGGTPPSAGKAGGPAANGKPWTMKRGLVVAGAATVLAAGAGATVYGLGTNAAAAGGTAAGAQGGLPQDGGSMGRPGGMQAPGSGTVPGQGGDFAPNGLGGMGSGFLRRSIRSTSSRRTGSTSPRWRRSAPSPAFPERRSAKADRALPPPFLRI